MKTYGPISYSTVGAPTPITGICENFSYKDLETLTEVMDQGEIAALVSHGRKGQISFSSTPPATVTELGVRAGNSIDISSIVEGTNIVTTADAKWQRGQPMVMSAQATNYPYLSTTTSGNIVHASLALAHGSAGALVLPTDKVWYSTAGLTGPVAGIVQSCSISETVQIQEEEEGSGKITSIVIHGYKATASMEILSSASIPALGSTLAAFGGFRIQSAEEKYAKGAVRSIMVEGILVPGVTS